MKPQRKTRIDYRPCPDAADALFDTAMRIGVSETAILDTLAVKFGGVLSAAQVSEVREHARGLRGAGKRPRKKR